MRRGLLASGAAALILAGCGGGGHKTSSSFIHASTQTQTTGTSPQAATPASGLTGHVLANNELPGFTGAAPVVERDPRLYLVENQTPSSDLGSETARLRQLGFVAAINQNLKGRGQGALSVVEQFRSPASARSEFAHELAIFEGQAGTSFVPFKVSGVPGAVGFGESGPSGGGINVAWADGDYYYLVGETVPSITKSTESTLTTAAHHLYRRTHG